MTERLKFLIFNASLLLKNEFKIKLVLLKPKYGDTEDKRLAFPASLNICLKPAYHHTNRCGIGAALSIVTPRPRRKEKTVATRPHKPEAKWEKQKVENAVSHRFYLVLSGNHQQN